MNFKTWIFLAESQQAHVEVQVGNFLTAMFEQAGSMFKLDRLHGERGDFTRYLMLVWPQDAQQNGRFYLPRQFPEGIAGKPVRFVKGDERAKSGAQHKPNGSFNGFVFNMAGFDEIRNPEDIDKYVDALGYKAHHEAEHIYNPGTILNMGDSDQMRAGLHYMSNIGEIRAHAREMARAYAKHHPGEDFDLHKAQSLLQEPQFNDTHRNYYQMLAEPGKWERYRRQYGLSFNPHDLVIQATRDFLPQYQN